MSTRRAPAQMTVAVAEEDRVVAAAADDPAETEDPEAAAGRVADQDRLLYN